MKNLGVCLIFVLVVITSCAKKETKVEWVSTTPESIWQVTHVTSSDINTTDTTTIHIHPEKEQQSVNGFGGCFNELGWDVLNVVSKSERTKIMESLFDSITGCKFNKCRMPIGANDYALDWYSHNESVDDFKMNDFSIGRDKGALIPYIKEAQGYNPDLKLWASPWSPPSWMKTNNHYACMPDSVNDLEESGMGTEMHSQFRMEEKYLSAYALYFSKFIQAYKNEGIDIYAVHVQNEPNSCQNFPSCVWNPNDLGTFIGGYLGPRFYNDDLDTDIWLGTIERPQIERIDSVLMNPDAKKYIKGVGFQWAGKNAIPKVNEKYPELELMQTETECGDGSNDWKAAEYTFNLMKHYFNNGANSYLYWNMVLDETGKSQWGWKQNSMISIDRASKEITYNPEFYVMKHFSAYIDLGAHKIETSDGNCLAFKNADSVIVIYYNPDRATSKTFKMNDSEFTFELAEKSFNTFEISI